MYIVCATLGEYLAQTKQRFKRWVKILEKQIKHFCVPSRISYVRFNGWSGKHWENL